MKYEGCTGKIAINSEHPLEKELGKPLPGSIEFTIECKGCDFSKSLKIAPIFSQEVFNAEYVHLEKDLSDIQSRFCNKRPEEEWNPQQLLPNNSFSLS